MIKTLSCFYLGQEINEDNCMIDFDEGAGELTAELDLGSYTPTELAAEVERKMNFVGGQPYNVSFSRSTLKLTISAGNSFTLLVETGTNAANGAFSTLGYATGADLSGSSITASNDLCTVYKPQFYLQAFVDPSHEVAQLHATVNETITGRQELITYGDLGTMRCNITFITDIAQPSNGPIESNPSGVADALRFLRWITRKNKTEFIPDRADVETFYNIVLDSSVASKDGTKFRLRELYDKGLTGYYETETLIFRKVD